MEILLAGFFTTLLVALVFETVLFFIGSSIKRDDIVDVGWGFGFIVIALFWLLAGVPTLAGSIITLLVGMWGVRLSYHILTRFIQKDEDQRYVEMKEGWKYPRLRAYLQIYLLQGLLMSLIALPIMIVAIASVGETLAAIGFGFAIWLMGLVFQVTGDLELTKHIASKKGGLLKTGIWSYTRHPNYFGEAMMWWGILVIASSNLSLGATLVAMIGPIVITGLLRFVSGVPMLEKHWKTKYGEEFEKYASEVPAFIPKLKR